MFKEIARRARFIEEKNGVRLGFKINNNKAYMLYTLHQDDVINQIDGSHVSDFTHEVRNIKKIHRSIHALRKFIESEYDGIFTCSCTDKIYLAYAVIEQMTNTAIDIITHMKTKPIGTIEQGMFIDDKDRGLQFFRINPETGIFEKRNGNGSWETYDVSVNARCVFKCLTR